MQRVCLFALTLSMLATIPITGCETPILEIPQPAPCLSIDDVINIPSGNAVETIDWGVYRGVSIVRTSCTQCELNTVASSKCTEATLNSNFLTFQQTGGRLTAEGPNSVLAGGIDTDGTFTIGTISTPVANDGTFGGQGLVLIEGQFIGNRIITTLTTRVTISNAEGTIDLMAVHSFTLDRLTSPQSGQ